MARSTFFVKFLSLLAFAIPVFSQIGYNENSNTLLCSKPGGVYCVHRSLAGSTTISCVGPTTAEIRSCSIELSDILPKELAELAVCYESDPTAGDAVCAVNGTGFTLLSHRTTIAVPETILCDSPSPEKDSSPYQGILHQGINSKPPAQPRFTPIPLPPPVTLGYVPARETVHAGPVVPCSDPWSRSLGRARVSHGLLPVYLASSVTAPVSAASTGFLGYNNAQAGSGSSRLGASASAADGVQGDIQGLVSSEGFGDSGKARSTGSSLISGGGLHKEEPKCWFALLAMTIVVGCAGIFW